MQSPGPPQQEDDNLEWAVIKQNMDSLYETGTLTRAKYIESYSHIHEFCVSQRSSPRRGVRFHGQILYENLTAYLSDLLANIRREAADMRAEQLFGYYNGHWERYHAFSNIQANLWNFLQRHWVKREQDEKNNVLSIPQLHLHSWKTLVLDELEDRLIQATKAPIPSSAGGESTALQAQLRFLESLRVIQTFAEGWDCSGAADETLVEKWQRIIDAAPGEISAVETGLQNGSTAAAPGESQAAPASAAQVDTASTLPDGSASAA